MSYYFVHPLRDDGSSFSYQTYPYHDGSNYPNKVDISNLTLGHTNGNRVLSMTNGIVIGVGTFSGGEGYVVVQVTDADAAPVKRIRYIHLNNTNFAVSQNQQVTKGQLLGYVADYNGPGFGEGSGAHLHVDFGVSENGIDFDDFAPIGSSNLVSIDYDETTYNSLCAGRGVSSDISFQYYWPYMLWAQKLQTVSEASSISGTTVDCSNIQPQSGIFVGYATDYNRTWDSSSKQYLVSTIWRAQTESAKWNKNIATIDGRYLVAVVTGSFGHVGDKIDIKLANNEVIHAIIADSKNTTNADDSGATNSNGKWNRWGHLSGPNEDQINIVEFEINGDPSNINTPQEWFSQDVISITVGESILGG